MKEIRGSIVKPRIDKGVGGRVRKGYCLGLEVIFTLECARAQIPLEWDQILRLFQRDIFSVALPQAEDSADFGPICGLAAI
jgi:hypothetical protein